jgi:hypothetical protein
MNARGVGLSLALAVVAAAGVMTVAASAAASDPAPAITAVRLLVDGSPVAVARSYKLTGQSEGENKKAYLLELERGLTSDPSLVSAFGSGQTFPSATLEVLEVESTVLLTYALTDVCVRSFTHDGSELPLEKVVLRVGEVMVGS